MRKPSGNLCNLPEGQRVALERWLLDDAPTLTYVKAQARLKAEFGVETSTAALSKFYHRRTQARVYAQVVAAQLQEHPVLGPVHEVSPAVFKVLIAATGEAALEAQLKGVPLTLPEMKGFVGLAVTGLKEGREEQVRALQVREVARKERVNELRLRMMELERKKMEGRK